MGPSLSSKRQKTQPTGGKCFVKDGFIPADSSDGWRFNRFIGNVGFPSMRAYRSKAKLACNGMNTFIRKGFPPYTTFK